jgi:hypothetical protein
MLKKNVYYLKRELHVPSSEYIFLVFLSCSCYGFRVQDEEEISPVTVGCVGYHVGYDYCGVCEYNRDLLWL